MTTPDHAPDATPSETDALQGRHLDDDTLSDALFDALRGLDEHGSATALPDEDSTALVREFLDFGVLTSSSDSAAKWTLLARLLAHAVFEYGPYPSHLVFAGSRLERAPRPAIDGWLDELLELIRRSGDDVQARWHEALGREPSRTQPVIPSGRIRVARTEADWSVPDGLQLWSEDAIGFLDRGLWAPLALLQRWDIDEWFSAVDRWGDPRFVQSALLFVEERVGADDLLRLLERAQPCFDDTSAPTQAAAAVVLSQAVQAAARRLQAEDSEASRNLLERLSSTLLQRTDGIALGLALAADLTDKVVNTHSRVEPHVRTLWEVLLDALARGHVPLQRQRECFARRRQKPNGRSGGVRRVRPALLVAAKVLDPSRIDEVEAFIAWLGDVLQSEEHWGIWATSVNELLPALAAALGGLDHPRARCRSAYAVLEGQRRHAHHRHGEPDLVFPSLLLLLVLASLCDTGPAEGLEADLEFGKSQAFRIALTSGSATRPTVSAWEVAAIFLTIGCVKFGLDDPRAVGLVRPLAGDTQVLGHLLQRLASMASGAQLREWLGKLGRDPDEAVGQADAWAAASEGQVDRQIAEWTRTALDPSRAAEPQRRSP